MSLEKPIATVRKAVEALAERRAKKEFLEKPEQRHYESAFTTFKMLRMLEPERFKIGIKINANEYELKNEMGNEVFNIFNSVWEDATKNAEQELKDAEEQLKMTKKLSSDELKKELQQLDERFLNSKTDQIKNDQHIINAFSGKKELLDKAIGGTVSGMRELMKYNRENPSSF